MSDDLFRMRFCLTADAQPYHCAALPQLGQRHDKGYVRLGELAGFDNVAYASVEFLHCVARVIPEAGLALREDLDTLQAQLDQAEAEVSDLKAQLQEQQAELEAIDLLARKDGQYMKQKRTGRPPKESKQQQGVDA